MKIKSLKLYDNGAMIRIPNRKISLIKNKSGDGFLLEFMKYEKDMPETPSCGYETIRKDVLLTRLGISDDGMDALMIAYVEYKKNKEK